MNALEVLKAARAKITLPEHWTQGTGARDAQGHSVSADCEAAVCWCSLGAINAAAPGMTYHDAKWEARMALGDTLKLYDDGIINYNDTHKHEEVLVKFDEAITSLEGATA